MNYNMYDEMMEQPDSLRKTFESEMSKLNDVSKLVSKVDKVYLIGCGSSISTCYTIRDAIRMSSTNINIEVFTGYEFFYNKKLTKNENSIAIFASQSGETADTLASLRKAKSDHRRDRGRCHLRRRPAGGARRGGGGSRQAGELLQGEDRLHGHVEVAGDAQGQVEGGRVLAALEVAHRLVVDAQRLGELAAAHPPVGAQHRDPVVHDVVGHHRPVWERMVDCTRVRLPIVSLRKLRRTTNEAPAKPRTIQAVRIARASAGEKAPPTSHEGSPTNAHRVRCPDQYTFLR